MPAGGMAAYRELLGENRRYRNLFWAMLTSSLGDWIGVVAIIALTDQIQGGSRAAAFGISIIMIARVVPTLLLGPVAGVFVDRWDRKRTMIVTDIGRGVVMALLAFAGDLFALILATLVIEVMSTLFIPAKDSSIPNLVEERRLVHANQISIGATYGTFPLGGTLFALMVGFATTFLGDVAFLRERPLALPIWFNAATFFVSAVFIARIGTIPSERRAPEPSEVETSAWEQLKEGFEFITQQPLVRSLVVGVMAACLAAGAVISLGELFASAVNAPSTGFGVLIAAVGFGLLGGLVGTIPLSRRLEKERLFAPGIAVAGVALVVAALMPRLDMATVPAFAMGAGAGVSFLSAYTLLQERTSDSIRGRTFAAFNTGVRLALFVSLVVAPALAAVIGPEAAGDYAIGGVRVTLMLAGLVALAGAVWSGHSMHRALTEADRVPHPHPGMLVAFEGGEGAGKSTQIRRLRTALERSGREVVTTREPGGTGLGERIRDLLLDTRSDSLGDRAEALLYAAARSQHVEEVIRPALERGAVVLTDRFVDSSIAYQGVARGLGIERIEELNRWGTRDVLPDLVILLDVPAEEGLGRVGRRARRTRPAGGPEPAGGREGTGVPGGDAPPRGDRLESAGSAFHRAVNRAFREQAAAHPDRFLVLDATRDEAELGKAIREAVLERLESR